MSRYCFIISKCSYFNLNWCWLWKNFLTPHGCHRIWQHRNKFLLNCRFGHCCCASRGCVGILLLYMDIYIIYVDFSVYISMWREWGKFQRSDGVCVLVFYVCKFVATSLFGSAASMHNDMTNNILMIIKIKGDAW